MPDTEENEHDLWPTRPPEFRQGRFFVKVVVAPDVELTFGVAWLRAQRNEIAGNVDKQQSGVRERRIECRTFSPPVPQTLVPAYLEIPPLVTTRTVCEVLSLMYTRPSLSTARPSMIRTSHPQLAQHLRNCRDVLSRRQSL